MAQAWGQDVSLGAATPIPLLFFETAARAPCIYVSAIKTQFCFV